VETRTKKETDALRAADAAACRGVKGSIQIKFNEGPTNMSEKKFLQADPEYAKLSATIQEWSINGTQQEQEALAFYFEKAMRHKLGLSDNMIEKGVTDLNKISVARFEEIKQTAADFVERLFSIVDTTINTNFEKAEAECMQKLEDKIKALEDHGYDDMINAKLADKPEATRKAIWKEIGDPEIRRSDLDRLLKKKREAS